MLNKFNNQVFKYNSTKQNESLLIHNILNSYMRASGILIIKLINLMVECMWVHIIYNLYKSQELAILNTLHALFPLK